MIEVCLSIDCREAHSESDAAVLVREFASAVQSGWAIVQSYRALEFTHWSASRPELGESFGIAFSGRIFGGNVETRWIREGSHWRIVRIHEAPLDTGARRFRPRLRPYILWGDYKRDAQRFVEDRIPGIRPYPLNETPVENDRACIEVCEYESIVDTAPTAADLERRLNEPVIAAHRFICLKLFPKRNQQQEEPDAER